ncbi:hypothetical protein CN606_17705 [Bacillus toyonensis]|uniref:hypothetical protein n=1 Tax=Bacillus toyonensis TaxID=155322 RepID=UPI000BF004E2|nr:hypothetical protein [Bacillus toyonensis]PEL01330.1 hypothetical protein CN606_17705 [Bacillus toyonensis]
MDLKIWSMKVQYNGEHTSWNIGPHFYFFDGNADTGHHPVPLFSSPHVNILEKGEATRAYARIDTLLRLVNGLSLITRGLPIYSLKEFFYQENQIIKEIPKRRDPSIFLEELGNPFDDTVIEEMENQKFVHGITASTDYAELIVKDELVREVVYLLSLSMEEELYLLMNAYKILEIIRNDMGFEQKNGEGKLRENEISKEYSFTSVFELQKLSGYMNNKGASGIFCRHGFSSRDKKIKAPSYDEIVDIIIIAISEWMSYKSHVKFGRRYNPSKGILDFYKRNNS